VLAYNKPKMAFGKRVSVPGCDDAPVECVTISSNAKPVTLIYPYYDNPQMLRRHVDHWALLPYYMKQHLSAIIVDDGSPNVPAVQVLAEIVPPFPISLYRIDVDVRWNWLAARNIGWHHAPEGWGVVTDVDHLIPVSTLLSCIYGEHDDRVIYRFMREEHTGEVIHPHPNSWMMTREMYHRVGGYDEALSGHYGTDGEYRRRCVKTAPIRILSDKLVRHEHVGDSSTVRYLRKQPEDAAVSRIVAARGKGWKPKTLSFPYHKVTL
jgi:hypothetical protein